MRLLQQPLRGFLGFDFVSVVTEKPLISFRQLSEVNLRDSELVHDHDTVWLDAGHPSVFVFFPAKRFVVVGECE